MFQFPYYAEVWGTISDWVIIIVTIVTGVLIWETFKSQQEVTRIEQHNFRLRAIPELKAQITGSGIQVTVLLNPIKHLRTAFIKLNRFQYFNIHHHFGDFDPGAEISVDTGFSIRISGDGKMVRSMLHDEIILFFLDKQDNLYRQTLIHNPNYAYVRPQTAVYLENLSDPGKFDEIVDEIIKKEDLIKNKNI